MCINQHQLLPAVCPRLYYRVLFLDPPLHDLSLLLARTTGDISATLHGTILVVLPVLEVRVTSADTVIIPVGAGIQYKAGPDHDGHK